MKQKITATTFQLTHTRNAPVKCTFDVGDKVISPLGIGTLIELNKETGDCIVELEE